MKRNVRLLAVRSAAAMVTTAMALTAAPAYSAEKDVAAQLEAKIAQLSPSQQAALLLFLDGRAAAQPAEMAKEESPKDAMEATLNEFNAMVKSKTFNMDKFFERISENFKHPVVGGKKGVREFLDSMKNSGLFENGIPDVKFEITDTKYEVDGDKVEAYPVDLDTPLGSFTLSVFGKKENGVWRLVGIDGL